MVWPSNQWEMARQRQTRAHYICVFLGTESLEAVDMPHALVWAAYDSS